MVIKESQMPIKPDALFITCPVCKSPPDVNCVDVGDLPLKTLAEWQFHKRREKVARDEAELDATYRPDGFDPYKSENRVKTWDGMPIYDPFGW